MAVIDHIDGLEVNFRVDGAVAEEYGHADAEDVDPPSDMKFFVPPSSTPEANDASSPAVKPEAPYVVKYVEAKPGLPFSVVLKRGPSFKHHGDHIAYSFSIDNGPPTQLRHDQTIKCGSHEARCWTSNNDSYGKRNNIGGWDRIAFHFAALETRDDPITVDELKAQRFKPGEATSFEVVQPIVDWHKDFKHRPFAVFEFRYRSMEGLINEGIITRPIVGQPPGPSLNEIEAKRLAESMDLEEARRLARAYLV
ncbi:hypothetical protein B0T16DRAFT_453273 [Cercophora newfieldiana]|uniref:DUF7918 domain-containing protein n=1 Tax=Cercophora newfieldiana TaxID=92897 RepID=A0AA40D119_9PEZI|nr:hypothetical protein B0T16DRAFT_453273 [Cercophora newfieldiana]